MWFHPGQLKGVRDGKYVRRKSSTLFWNLLYGTDVNVPHHHFVRNQADRKLDVLFLDRESEDALLLPLQHGQIGPCGPCHCGSWGPFLLKDEFGFHDSASEFRHQYDSQVCGLQRGGDSPIVLQIARPGHA